MGAPTIEDERLFSFFEDYKANITDGFETPTNFGHRSYPLASFEKKEASGC